MGNYYMKMKNETRDTYSYCFHYWPDWEGIRYSAQLAPYSEQAPGQREILSQVYVRYGQCDGNYCRRYPMLSWKYNGIDKPTFFLRESGDKIVMTCDRGGSPEYCDNMGELNRRRRREEQMRREREERELRRREEERRREEKRRREEERQQRERLERERRIQQQIEEENEELRNKLGRAAEKRQMNLNLKGKEKQHQRSHVLVQDVHDDAIPVDIDDINLAEERLQALMDQHGITVSAGADGSALSTSQKILKLCDQLVGMYCIAADLGIWYHVKFEDAVLFTSCSLEDQLYVVEALLGVIYRNEFADLVTEMKADIKVSNDQALMVRLMAAMEQRSRTLTLSFFSSALEIFPDMEETNKNYLGSLVFNKIWHPIDAFVFGLYTIHVGIKQKFLSSFLHLVRTYRVDVSQAVVALKSSERTGTLRDFIHDQLDKDLPTIIEEMRQDGVPEKILELTTDVVEQVWAMLPALKGVGIKDKLQGGIESLKKVDFDSPDITTFVEVLVGLSLAVHDEMNYFPRLTQLVSLVTLLVSRTPGKTGCLLEIGTGEGKSTIVAMLAVILAIRGSKVDIVTSSPLLAIRDVEEWEGFYKTFGLTVSAASPVGLSKTDTPDEMDTMVMNAYGCDIVYGTVANFAADILKQEFEKNTTRGTRGFDAVIIDEVDYMTLDNGVQVTYLSHSSTGMRHIEQLLAFIWNMTCPCRPIDDAETEERVWITNVKHFHKAVYSALFGEEVSETFLSWQILEPLVELGLFDDQDLANLKAYETLEDGGTEESKKEAKKLIDKMMKTVGPAEQRDCLTILETAMKGEVGFQTYIVEDGMAKLYGPKSDKPGTLKMLLLNNGLACELVTQKDLIDGVAATIGNRIKYSKEHALPKSTDKNAGGDIYIPSFLKEYVKDRLEVFAENALKAILMTKDREYTIDRVSAENIDKDESPHHYDCIIPIDFTASGVMEKNKRWGDGLQQFLEMKHQLALTSVSTVTNYLSNIHFFKRYAKGEGVFGCSGTLGEQSDNDFLTKHFQVSCYDIPSFRQKKLIELPVVQVRGGEEAWIDEVCRITKEAISPKTWCKGQATLVVCEDMKTADRFRTALLEVVENEDNLSMYTRSDKHKVEGKKFHPGDVIIATNLGGRGTNFKIDDDVNDSGGLFVILTHFPPNRRVEKQIYGRTARKGNPGLFQMVVNYLAIQDSYKDQTIDTMRRRRGVYERKRLAEMENDELQTVDINEQLFDTFCQKLEEFCLNYQGLEDPDLEQTKTVKDIPTILKALESTSKMDKKPAQNSFKETWAHWIILNEDRIEANEDVTILQQELRRKLDEKAAELLQGNSENYLDHTRQALGRMYMHEVKQNSDCGTLAAWDKAMKADPAYKAVALYNKAYILINVGASGYLEKAIALLKECKTSIDVYIQENSNTMSALQIAAAAGAFEPHNIGDTNALRQLEIRQSFVKIWLDYAGKGLSKLEELKKAGDDAITESTGVFAMIPKPNALEENELQELFNEGLQLMFTVKKKPKFCVDALVCFLLGALQVVAGVIVCVVSFGAASQIGLGLVAEGVGDMISGIEGMITGSFSWAEWAISKAISVGLSLVSAGLGRLKDVVKYTAKGVKALVKGTTSLSKVAKGALKSVKSGWKSARYAKYVVKDTTRNSAKEAMKAIASKGAWKSNMKYAAKYTMQEFAAQGVEKGVLVATDMAVQAFFEKLLDDVFKSVISSYLKESNDINDRLKRFIIIYGVPESTLRSENPSGYTIPPSSTAVMERQVKSVCDTVTPQLVTDYKVVNDLFSRLTTIKDGLEDIFNELDRKGRLTKGVDIVVQLGAHTTKFVQLIKNMPTKELLNSHAIPLLKKEYDTLLHGTTYTDDARKDLETVKKMKEKLFKIMTDKVAKAFTDACATSLNSFLTEYARTRISAAVGSGVGNVLGKYKSENYFKKQQEKYHTLRMTQEYDVSVKQPLKEIERVNMKKQTEMFETDVRSATVMELNALTETKAFGGRSLEVISIDVNGAELCRVNFTGTNEKAGTVKIRLTREKDDKGLTLKEKIKNRIDGDEDPWTGHFDIIKTDGSVTRINQGPNKTLFFAIAKAIDPKSDDAAATSRAASLKKDVAKVITTSPEKYTAMYRRQKDFEAVYESEGTFFSLPHKDEGDDSGDANSTAAKDKKDETDDEASKKTDEKTEKKTEDETTKKPGEEDKYKYRPVKAPKEKKEIGKKENADEETKDKTGKETEKKKEKEEDNDGGKTPSEGTETESLLWSYRIAKTSLLVKEKMSELCHNLSSLDKSTILKTMKVAQSVLTTATAKPVGVSTTKKKAEVSKKPTIAEQSKTIAFLPKLSLDEFSSTLNPAFIKWKGASAISMVIPINDNDLLLSSDETPFHIPYLTLLSGCINKTGPENNPSTLMKLAIICSNPDASFDARKDVGLDQPKGNRKPLSAWALTDEGFDAYYKVCYMTILGKYRLSGCLDEMTFTNLISWVEDDLFLDDKDATYVQVLEALRTYKKVKASA